MQSLKLFTFCVLGFLCTFVRADVFEFPVSIPEVNTAFVKNADRLNQHATLAGSFSQEKFLKVLSRPILSAGGFSYSQGKSFEWHITKPIDVAYFAKGDDIYLLQGGKKRAIEQRKDPVLHGFMSVFVQVLGADYSQLEKHFDLFFSQEGENWTIGLKPTGLLMKKAIGHLVISGATHVKSLRIQEPSGDHTTISFVIAE